MLLDTIFAPFVQECSVCVMARAVLERLLDAPRIDALFARTAERQYTRELLFSSLMQLMSEVMLGVHNAVSLIKAALRSAHGRQKVNEEVSSYYLSLEISRTYDGMMIAIPAPHWGLFRVCSVQEFATMLRALALLVNPPRYQKHLRGPKKKPPERMARQNGQHVSTAKLLAQR